MRSSLTVVLTLAAVISLSACSGSEKAPAEQPPAAAEASPAETPVRQAPSFDTIPVDKPAEPTQPPPPAPSSTPEPQQQPVGFRVPADAIGGEKMGTATFDIASRGELALRKHFTDAGVDPSTFYFKIPVEQRGNYWTMMFYGNPPTQPDGMYVEVRVYPDGSAEVMR
jgi:predicted small lipoprotein YifL